MSDDGEKLKIDNACRVAEEFTKLYFYSFDMKRHKINNFYMNNATLSWDGNAAIGKEAIQKFLEELPETNHNLIALDAQPVMYEGVKDQQIVLVQVGGTIKFPSKRETKGFTQSFLITADENKWRIVSDTCRLQLLCHNGSCHLCNEYPCTATFEFMNQIQETGKVDTTAQE